MSSIYLTLEKNQITKHNMISFNPPSLLINFNLIMELR